MKMFDALVRLKEHKRMNLLKQPSTKYLHDAFELAFDAMGKQIPMKPNWNCAGIWCCKSCDKYLIRDQLYCKHCGQAQDWKDTDEK